MSTAPHTLTSLPAGLSARRPRADAPASRDLVSDEVARRVRRARTTAARVELVLAEARVVEIMGARAVRALRSPRASAKHRRRPLGPEAVPEVIQEAVIDVMGLAERRGYRTAQDIAGALVGCVQGAAERLCELAAQTHLNDPTGLMEEITEESAENRSVAPQALVDALVDERLEQARRAEALARLYPADRRVFEVASDDRLSVAERAAALGLVGRAYRDRVNYVRLVHEAELERVRSGVYCDQARRLFPRMLRAGQLEATIGERLAGRVRLHLAHCPTCPLERRRRAVGLRTWVPWPLFAWLEARWTDAREAAVRVAGGYTPSPGMATEKAIAGAGGAAGAGALKLALASAAIPVLVLGSLTVADRHDRPNTTPPRVSAAAAATAPAAPARRATPTTTRTSTSTAVGPPSSGGGGLVGAADEFEPGGTPTKTTSSRSPVRSGGSGGARSPAVTEFAP